MQAVFPDFTFVYIDAEFTPDDHSPRGLISLALHSRAASVYMVNSGADKEEFCSNEFRRDHIWSKLPLNSDGNLNEDFACVMNYEEIRRKTDDFFRELTRGTHYRSRVGIIADHGTQDMQRIHDLWQNDWMTMPEWIPRRPFTDIATLEDLAGATDGHLLDGTPLPRLRPEVAHHAMRDAEHDEKVHQLLMEHSVEVRIASGVERFAEAAARMASV